MNRLIQKLLLSLACIAVTTITSSLTGFGFVTSARAETTECTEILSLPFTITVQGIYCFKQNLVTAQATGNVITINTNNVTIDMNGFKLGGQAAGAGTEANGISATDRNNITIRNGNIRGFLRGISLDGTSGSGHVIEQVRADGNTQMGFLVNGDNIIIRNNHVINTGPNITSAEAYGITAQLTSNTLIADNVVSGVSETGAASGILILNSSTTEVRGNSIYELDATIKSGIDVVTSTEIAVIDNRIINSVVAGTKGINDNGSSALICIGNSIIGYTTATFGCDLLDGNRDL